MSKVPRASLCITILDDEDYRILMTTEGGAEAFGVFVAMLVLGRERLQQGKAHQIHGTDSLVLDNSTTHLTVMTHVSPEKFARCLETLAAVAKGSGEKPWMYLDRQSHLVVRSFFKFNTNTGWGGPRTGAGRVARHQREARDDQDESEGDQVGPRTRNQDDSQSGIKMIQDESRNQAKEDIGRQDHAKPSAFQDEIKLDQLDSHSESSCVPSGSGSGSKTTNTPLPPKPSEPPRKSGGGGFDPSEFEEVPRQDPAKPFTNCGEAIKSIRKSVGDKWADAAKSDRKRIDPQIEGHWDFLATAFGSIAGDVRDRDGTIRNPMAMAISIAKGYIVDGPPDPDTIPMKRPQEALAPEGRPIVFKPQITRIGR